MAQPPSSDLSSLDARAREIFREIVESYLTTGEPVGSRTLSKLGGMGLSPASIRNTMADLAALGLLDAPHAMAGRRPTQAGLRFFVDSLPGPGDLGPAQAREVRAFFSHAHGELERSICSSSTSQLLSRLTATTAMVVEIGRASCRERVLPTV